MRTLKNRRRTKPSHLLQPQLRSPLLQEPFSRFGADGLLPFLKETDGLPRVRRWGELGLVLKTEQLLLRGAEMHFFSVTTHRR